MRERDVRDSQEQREDDKQERIQTSCNENGGTERSDGLSQSDGEEFGNEDHEELVACSRGRSVEALR